MPGFKQNDEMTYIPNKYVSENTFIGSTEKPTVPPKYEDIRKKLPKPIFDGHDDYIKCYEYAWKTAFGNLSLPKDGTGFVSSFIDAAFNGCIFMWDCSFITMFTKYAEGVFPFQKTLDNFYSHQHRDGFISREIEEDTGLEHFTRYDPSSTGPNILAWSEMQYYDNMHDGERLARVYPALRAFHNWMRENRTWRDGSYFSSGWGCGMDNVPRFKCESEDTFGYECQFSHGHMVWVDICLEQLLNCDILIRMNEILGGGDDVSDLVEERERLSSLVNDILWDDGDGFYFDQWRNGELNHVKHIGAYWALVADVVPKERLKKFLAHLENPNEFCRQNAVPTLSADHPMYAPDGYYWRGGVWAPTTYMVLCGLEKQGDDRLRYEIADKFLRNVVEVYNKTGTLWENYKPDSAEPGIPARPEFVGWTGLAPISIFFEHVLGIRANVAENTIIWDVNRTERHGIERYPFGKDATVDLVCEARASDEEEPKITVRSDKPITVVVKWNGREKVIQG